MKLLENSFNTPWPNIISQPKQHFPEASSAERQGAEAQPLKIVTDFLKLKRDQLQIAGIGHAKVDD
ncbi:hypothetical protein [uncultured Roseobacter sp.]|uniref:hypothetical protein n=1 Tax=uncultured Roseobacter sp. TaxID=114847 RepID=UPI0026193664|nr:hypothetical protein [uncultured Roseobacter sp.]